MLEHRVPTLSIEDIQEAARLHFGARPGTLTSNDVDDAAASARQVAMYLCAERLRRTPQEIGLAFGGRSAAHVADVVGELASRIGRDKDVAAVVEAILLSALQEV
jgi:chromosomal replication initiation ATPase DnaA